MTGLLRGLERDRLVDREPHADDRRVSTIRLSRRGRDHLNGMLPDHFARLTALVGHLSAREQRDLVRLLRKVGLGLPALSDAAHGGIHASRGRRGRDASRRLMCSAGRYHANDRPLLLIPTRPTERRRRSEV